MRPDQALARFEYMEPYVTLTDEGTVSVVDEAGLRDGAIDRLIRDAVFGPVEQRAAARWLIWEIGQDLGVRPASIHDFYMARGRGEVPTDFTVPAMNLRGIAYDMARAVFRAALKLDVGALICEIARSEIGYTAQRPGEYTAAVVAAAIKEGFRGPVFIQGDHFQVSAKGFASDPDKEIAAVRDLIVEAINAGFFNIDVDTSTLVDLSHEDLMEQQRQNYQVSSALTAFIRSIEPEGVTISVGGEIGEVGGKNSTEPELRAYMDGYNKSLSQFDGDLVGLSKISIQTGTSHGGVVLPDGTLADVKIDFDTLERLSIVAREEYGLAGAVQHGASTLPDSAFRKFAETGACEVHLATGFQNLIYEHPALPAEVREKAYAYIKEHHADEWKEGQTEDQFIYKTRKKAFGGIKADWWSLPPDVLHQIGVALEDKFAFLFEQLNVPGTRDLVNQFVQAPEIHKAPEDFVPKTELAMAKDLAD
ncbi:MAG: aldolase [Chloroflexi bacterium]|nr:MAG: aldolase [Chloroflexota bacterium]